jgi:sugar phosphate isomerase/epimerase
MSASCFPFGYCTNVHAGVELAEARANLLRVATAVRDQVQPGGSLPVGLWLAERAARELLQEATVAEFADWLGEQRLVPYTFNGFPQGDFHQAVVKHAVYEPDWRSTARRDYTIALATVLARLLDGSQCGSISTLPLGWPHTRWEEADYQAAAQNLLEVARHLETLAQNSGQEIVLAIEPEPGCVLDTATDLVAFFERYLFRGPDAEIARRYLTVCHDICHSAVMFEPQPVAIDSYVSHGIRLGKVQVSAAVAVDWPAQPTSELAANELAANELAAAQMLQQLKQFNEPRYLHQTTRQRAVQASGESPAESSRARSSQSGAARADGGCASAAAAGVGEVEMRDDLHQALADWTGDIDAQTGWRVHFHVPIFVDRFGGLRGTRDDIDAAVAAIGRHRGQAVGGRPWFTGHYEVETYAWGVLPPELQVRDLAEGIARELRHFQQVLAAQGLADASSGARAGESAVG